MIADFAAFAHPGPDPRSWLDHIPAERRGVIGNWFHQAVRTGAATPQAVLAVIQARCHGDPPWRGAPDGPAVLQALTTDPAGALAYAASVIQYEALPYALRQQVKAERTWSALKTTMRGKPVTEAQRWKLTSLGYCGKLPEDRATASELIDTLLKQGRGRLWRVPYRRSSLRSTACPSARAGKACARFATIPPSASRAMIAWVSAFIPPVASS